MAKKKTGNDNVLVRLSSFFFKNWRFTMVIWVILLAFGTATYTSVIKREGFPAIQFPLSVVQGTYFVDDVNRVDQDVLLPMSEVFGELESVDTVTAQAGDNFFSAQVDFVEGTDPVEGTAQLQQLLDTSDRIPEQVNASVITIDPASFLVDFDVLLSVYSTNQDVDIAELESIADFVAQSLVNDPVITKAEPQFLTETATNPQSGEQETRQTKFNQVGLAQNSELEFYPAITIGLDRDRAEIDILEMTDLVNEKIDELDLSRLSSSGSEFAAVISADFASEITGNISFLESNMLGGLLAVAVVSFLLISWRASIITALFMVTVMIATIVTLYLIGYTLNVITLFALILSLGLFVDDATIVVEALDAHRKDKKLKGLQIVRRAVKKVGLASFAGTLTTILVFALLATPTGILGEFIRLIPVTVILALSLSFILSITLIPFISRYLMIRDQKVSWLTSHNPVVRLEEWLGGLSERTVLGVRTMRGKLVGTLLVFMSIFLVMSGMNILGTKVEPNFFPSPKDADGLGIVINYTPGTTIVEAETIASEVEQVVLDTLGDQAVFAHYGAEQLPDNRQATLLVDLVPFTDRDIKAPQLQEQLEQAFGETTIAAGSINVGTIDNGPPQTPFPFGVRVYSDDDDVLRNAAQTISDRLVGEVLEGVVNDVTIVEGQISGVDGQVLREDGRRYAITRFAYDRANPTLVALLTEERFKEIYDDVTTPEQLGVSVDMIEFDAGQDGDFADSFNALALAAPIGIVLMYILLAVQFRSFLQPALILLAIPFTVFGVGFGMFVTDNPTSFFVLVGFIGLIGIAVNNTIMLTDYANQERRAGKGSVEAIAAASRKRFRPLVATTVTTIVALLPLALSDPFWEALAYTIIFGLASSTFLVIVSFPYYYLCAEWLRTRTGRAFRRIRSR